MIITFGHCESIENNLFNTNKNFFFTHEGKTVKDNLPISFTMRGEDFIQCRRRGK